MQQNNSNVDILFFLEDPGSINFLKDLPKYLNNEKISFNYICEGLAFSFFKDQPFFFDKKEMNAKKILSIKKPKLIVVGTSENKRSFSFNLVKEAKKVRYHQLVLLICYAIFKIDLRAIHVIL